MGEEDFGYDAGLAGVDVSVAVPEDTTSYIQTQLGEAPTGNLIPAVDPQTSGQTTSWIQDALGYIKTGASYASGIAGSLGIRIGGITTPQVAPAPTRPGVLNSPQPVQVGQGTTGPGMPWYFYGLLAAGALIVLYFLLYE
jgi:hypothetical protein